MSKKVTTETFIEKAKAIHGDKYDYSLVDYKNAKTKVKIICPVHGVFEQTPNSHLNGRGCSKCKPDKISKKLSFTTEEFIKKAKEVHGDKYDYSLVDYKGICEKVKIICPTHGIFEQFPNNHINQKQGCPVCKRKESLQKRTGKTKKLTTEEFIKKAKEIHGDKYDYSLVDYKNSHIKVKIICPIHGIFEQTPNNHLNGQDCPSCKISNGEKEIAKWLDKNGFKNKYKKEYYFDNFKSKNNKYFRYDFYIPLKNLLIEYNGIQHYKPSEYFGGQNSFLLRKHYDWLKRKYARDNGYKLLTIPYWDYKIIEEILEKEIC